MKKGIICWLTAVALFVLIFPAGLAAAQSPPKMGGLLPEINLPVPADTTLRDYLGLPSEGRFQVPQIKAEVVIIEVFSMYCPHCQKEAPEVNRLYQLIESNPDLKGRIKLIGLGAGNSLFEVEVFRKTYDILFPLFADGDFSIHRVLGEVRTPHFVGVKMTDDGAHNVFYSETGGFEGAEPFLEKILQLSGLK
jgi:thiol-disulfide isomerase/thioredoxin